MQLILLIFVESPFPLFGSTFKPKKEFNYANSLSYLSIHIDVPIHCNHGYLLSYFFQCETSPASDVPAISLPAGHCITICLCTLNPDISYLEYAGFCDIPKVFLPNFEAVIEANELGIIVTPCSCSMLTVCCSYNDIVLSTDHVGLLIICCCMLEKMFG